MSLSDLVSSKNFALLRSISGIGEVSAVVLLAELPNIAEFKPKALAAFAGLSPSEHSSGTSIRRPGKISRIGDRRLRGILYMCALSAKRANKALADFVRRRPTPASRPRSSLSPSPASSSSTPTPSFALRSRSILPRTPFLQFQFEHDANNGGRSNSNPCGQGSLLYELIPPWQGINYGRWSKSSRSCWQQNRSSTSCPV